MSEFACISCTVSKTKRKQKVITKRKQKVIGNHFLFLFFNHDNLLKTSWHLRDEIGPLA